MAACQHCGGEHPGPTSCPRTGLVMTAPGRCGSRVDRYLVERLLGTGTSGSVYLARHVRTTVPVALKVMKPELAADAALLERFMREARAAATVGDEHAVGVLDAEVTPEGVAFIAMELLEGDVFKALTDREKPLHPTRLLRLMAQVADGLAAAHDKGIVHRDMKPANIFIVRRRGSDGEEYEYAKLLDFGISKVDGPAAARLTVAGTTMGTPNYMAWEQFFDARQVDGRTDIYAVGVMLYELLGGKRPYEGRSLPELMQNVRTGGAAPLSSLAPSLPAQLCAVVEKAMAPRPEQRWATAREFAAVLRNVATLTGAAPPLGARAQVVEPAPREAVDPEAGMATVLIPKEDDGSPTEKNPIL